MAGGGSTLEIVLKVKDEATKAITTIGKEGLTYFQKIAKYTKESMSSIADVGKIAKGVFEAFGKVVEYIGKGLEILKKYAPEAREYLADIGEGQRAAITNMLESINRLKAALEGIFVEVVATFAPEIANGLDDITRRIQSRKEEFVQFFVDIGKFIADLFTRLAELIGKVFAGMAKFFEVDIDPEPVKKIKDELAAVREEMAQIIVQQNRGIFATDGGASRRMQDLAFRAKELNAELEKVRGEGILGGLKMPQFPATGPIPGLIAVPNETQKAASENLDKQIEANRAAWDALSKMTKDAQSKAAADAAKHFDALLALQDDYIRLQRQKVESATAALDTHRAAANARAEAEERQRNLDRAQLDEENEQRMNAVTKREVDRINSAARMAREARDKTMAELQQMYEAISSTMTNAMLNAFEAIVRGTMSVSQAVGTMVSQILIDVGRMLAQKQLEQFITNLLSTIGGGIAGSGSSGSKGTPVFSAPEPLAWGGPVEGGRAYHVGERGAEIFRASTSGTIVPSGMTINVNGATDPMETARQVRNEVMRLATTDAAFRRRIATV